jgi:hypothetical protein
VILESKGVKAVARYPLFKADQVIGFINADYVQGYRPTPEVLAEIQKAAAAIEWNLNQTKNKSWWAVLFSSGDK